MLEKLKELILQYTDDETVLITEETALLTDLGLNSYELTELICSVEDTFDVEIPDRTIGTFKTVQNVMDYIVACG